MKSDWNEEAARLLPCWCNKPHDNDDSDPQCPADYRPAVADALATAVVQGLEIAKQIVSGWGFSTGGLYFTDPSITDAIAAEIAKRKETP